MRKIIPPRELDVYIPEKKVAVEFNGMYWHSDVFTTTEYHQQKSVDCFAQGVRLLHIFEDDWERDEELCKDMILGTFGFYDAEIDALECDIKSLPIDEYNQFCIENHIKQSPDFVNTYGMYFKDELVCVFGYSDDIEGNRLVSYTPKKKYHIENPVPVIMKFLSCSEMWVVYDAGTEFVDVLDCEYSLIPPKLRYKKSSFSVYDAGEIVVHYVSQE